MKKSKALVHVNQHVLRANLKNVADAPMLTCKQGSKTNTYAHEVEVLGPSKFVNSMAKPLSCGARVWLLTEAPVVFRHYDPSASAREPTADATIIRVNQKAIRNNLKNGTNEPVLTCMRAGVETHGQEVLIHGPAKVRTANMALAHQTSIWVETTADIEVLEHASSAQPVPCPGS